MSPVLVLLEESPTAASDTSEKSTNLDDQHDDDEDLAECLPYEFQCWEFWTEGEFEELPDRSRAVRRQELKEAEKLATTDILKAALSVRLVTAARLRISAGCGWDCDFPAKPALLAETNEEDSPTAAVDLLDAKPASPPLGEEIAEDEEPPQGPECIPAGSGHQLHSEADWDKLDGSRKTLAHCCWSIFDLPRESEQPPTRVAPLSRLSRKRLQGRKRRCKRSSGLSLERSISSKIPSSAHVNARVSVAKPAALLLRREMFDVDSKPFNLPLSSTKVSFEANEEGATRSAPSGAEDALPERYCLYPPRETLSSAGSSATNSPRMRGCENPRAVSALWPSLSPPLARAFHHCVGAAAA